MKKVLTIAAVGLALVLFAMAQDPSGDNQPDAVATGADALMEHTSDQVFDPDATTIASEPIQFMNDGIEFVGEFTYPTNIEAHAVVVFVHGSEQFSAMEHYGFADGFAQRGIATLVFDKRGTGGSGGGFTFVLSTLASDMSAAINQLSSIPQVASLPLGLVAISQGGWVAPLVALERPDVDFLVMDSGSVLSQQETDRWVTEQWMKQQGVSASDIADAQSVMNAVYDTLACSFRCHWQDLENVKQAMSSQPWYAVLGQAPTNVGFVIGTSQPQLIQIFDGMGGGETNEEFRQDPLSILTQVSVASMWLYGEQDELVPAVRSAALLNAMGETRDVRMDVLSLPDEGHSIISRSASLGQWESIEPVFEFIRSEGR